MGVKLPSGEGTEAGSIGSAGPDHHTIAVPEARDRLLDDSQDLPLDIKVVAGAIKWFDVSKGYGFIVPDDGSKDILLHVTTLRRDGFLTALEGARVVCEVTQQSKGLQAFRVLSMDETTAMHSAVAEPARTHNQVVAESELVLVIVK
ncbi:MAG: cold shock domain-containing protein, partial [Rhizobiales bacterium]|nr:cold shock domain-containing protein [Hyphomicrobiales bacterium]